MGIGTTITIINGTPYTFQLTSDLSHAMNSWAAAPQVLPFGMEGFYAEWDSNDLLTSPKDQEALAVYAIQGTSSSFTLHASWSSNPLVTIDLSGMSTMTNDKGFEIPQRFVWNNSTTNDYKNTTIIMAGADNSFICPTSYPLIVTWMQNNLGRYGDLNLTQLCLPASHDSGMSVINGGTFGTDMNNCATQFHDIAGQLSYGVRFFDIRPVIHAGSNYTGHYTEKRGANSQKISEIISQINDFTASNAELIILQLTNSKDTDSEEKDVFTQAQWTALLEELSTLNHLYQNTTGAKNLTQLTLREFIGNGTAAVVIYTNFNDGVPDAGGKLRTLGDFHGQGFYYESEFPIFDKYAHTDDRSTLISDQTTKLRAFWQDVANSNVSQHIQPGARTAQPVFSLDWTLTQTTSEAVASTIGLAKSIRGAAVQINAWLPSTIVGNCWDSTMTTGAGTSQGTLIKRVIFPNLISMDAILDTIGLCMAMYINELLVANPVSLAVIPD